MQRITRGSGLTIIEILVSITIILLVSSVIIAGFVQYSYQQAFAERLDFVSLTLSEYRQRTLGAQFDDSYGVYIGTSSLVFYQGSSYATAVAQEPVALPSHIVATSSLSGGSYETTFARVTGIPSATGTINLSDTRTGKNATITISASGLIQ